MLPAGKERNLCGLTLTALATLLESQLPSFDT